MFGGRGEDDSESRREETGAGESGLNISRHVSSCLVNFSVLSSYAVVRAMVSQLLWIQRCS